MAQVQGSKHRYVDIGVTYTAPEFHGVYRGGGKKYHECDFDQVLQRASAVGCSKVILTTMKLKGARQNLEVCKNHTQQCYMTLGVHPYHANELYMSDDNGLTQSSLKPPLSTAVAATASATASTTITRLNELRDLKTEIEQQCGMNSLVAFGEIGLDYFYLERADKEVQQRAFQDQLELATQWDLPLFLHVRDSYDDFVRIIDPYLPRLSKKGVVHSFVGTREEMQGLVDLGFDVSVNAASFRDEQLLDMVRAVPLNRLQLETDAPWLELPSNHGLIAEYLKDASPLPPSRKHGKFVLGEMVKGRNESCAIERVARVVAGVKGVSLDEITEAAWENSVQMFGLR